MDFQAPFAELTDAQRQAVEWQDGPLLVLAAPGSGKTHLLARRVVRLLDASGPSWSRRAGASARIGRPRRVFSTASPAGKR